MEKPVFILTSSHMDREWYLPMDSTRAFFCQVLDRAFELLERLPGFKFFTDGQTSVVMDYLEARPDRLAEFRKYAAEGRLAIGPWHVQSDERMPAGESHIRNLLMGKKECEYLGGRMMLGYLPDTFGHIAQMPQILKQFGIERAFLMRGVMPQETGREFIWRGADGSEVFCVSCEYGNAVVMDFSNGLKDGIRMIRTPEEFQEKLEKALADKTKVADYTLLLVNSDCQTLPANLDQLGADHFNDYDEVFDYAEKFRDRCKTLTGELSHSPDIAYLQDTLASRIYLKTENARAQSVLMRVAEPLSCIYAPGSLSERGLINVAWKYLVENHTHDGITGCHSDATAREMMSRFEKCEHLAGQMRDFAMEDLAGRMDTSFAGEGALCVFHPRAMEDSPLAQFSLRVDEGRAGKYIRLFDAAGREAPVKIMSRRPVGAIRSNKKAQQMFSQAVQYDGYARFVNLPAMGMKAYRVEMCENEPKYAGVRADEGCAENQYVKMEISGGTIRLTDKRTGRVYEGLGALLDRGNKGDCYHFEPDGRETDVPCQGRLLWRNGAMAQFEFAGKDVRWTALLTADDPAVYVRMEIDNQETDHALFVRFPTGICGGESFRDQAYALETGKMGVQPTQTFAGFRKDGQGLAALHKGMHRAEFLEGGEMRLTALQAQGRLYVSFFPENHNDEFSECQVQRKVCLEYALLPLTGGEDLFGRAMEYVDGAATFYTGAHEGELGSEWSFLQVEGAEQSSIKREENGNRLLARLYNPTSARAEVHVRLPKGARNPAKLRLDETEIGPANPERMTLEAGEIATLAFEWEGMA